MKIKVKVQGLEEMIEHLDSVAEKASEIGKAADGKNDVQRTREELGLRNKPKLSPLMSSAHAKLVASGQATEEEISIAYWTIDDIASYLAED